VSKIGEHEFVGVISCGFVDRRLVLGEEERCRVCPNYAGRWVDEHQISSAPERTNLPIRNLVGSKDELCVPGHPIYTQMQRAINIAEADGYKNVSIVRVEGKEHERLADEVLAYFSTLLPQN
jgi:hypothetical protein